MARASRHATCPHRTRKARYSATPPPLNRTTLPVSYHARAFKFWSTPLPNDRHRLLPAPAVSAWTLTVARSTVSHRTLLPSSIATRSSRRNITQAGKPTLPLRLSRRIARGSPVRGRPCVPTPAGRHTRTTSIPTYPTGYKPTTARTYLACKALRRSMILITCSISSRASHRHKHVKCHAHHQHST